MYTFFGVAVIYKIRARPLNEDWPRSKWKPFPPPLPQPSAIDSSSFSHLVTSPLSGLIYTPFQYSLLNYHYHLHLYITKLFNQNLTSFHNPSKLRYFFKTRNLFLWLHSYQLLNELNLEQWVSVKQLNRAHKPITISSFCAPSPRAQPILWKEGKKKLYTNRSM